MVAMERVLKELKKVENEAEKIRREATERADAIIKLAHQGAERIISDAVKEAEGEVNRLMKNFEKSMERLHEKSIKDCEAKINELRRRAEKNKRDAVELVFKILTGEE